MTGGKEVLFALFEGGGNVPPQMSVARALVARGHCVRVLADRILRDEVEAAGAEHVEWTRAPQRTTWEPTDTYLRDWEARTPAGGFARVRDGLICGPSWAHAADVMAEIERRPPDVLVIDFMVFGARVAAEASGLPTAVMAHSVLAMPGCGIPPIGTGFKPPRGPLGRARDSAMFAITRRVFDKGLPALNATRRGLGLPPASSVIEHALAGDRVLLLTSRAFEFPQFAPPPNAIFVGPRLDDPAWTAEWSPPQGDTPIVLVGLSTTFMDQRAMLRRIAAALGELPVRGLITTGPAIAPRDIDAPPNVTVVESAPHGKVLRHAAAVVTHGGHGTMIKALAAGVPVVAMPMGRDQLDNAARLEVSGAGIRLRPNARPRRIAAALRSVLEQPAYAARASRIAATIADELRTDRALAEIEALAVRGGRLAENEHARRAAR